MKRGKTVIHVNQHVIRANSKRPVEEAEPCLTVKSSREGNRYAYKVAILDENGKEVARVVYDPVGLSCGSKCYIVTHNGVRLENMNGEEESKRYQDLGGTVCPAA
tara:strand:+ start:198 stop:512 length:315 start_codon:yes stop_codon:yes gene_type:complete